MSEQETWIFRAELRDADVRRDVGRDGCGSRSGRGNLRGGANSGESRTLAKSFSAKPSVEDRTIQRLLTIEGWYVFPDVE